jgi:hypothetical protein
MTLRIFDLKLVQVAYIEKYLQEDDERKTGHVRYARRVLWENAFVEPLLQTTKR